MDVFILSSAGARATAVEHRLLHVYIMNSNVIGGIVKCEHLLSEKSFSDQHRLTLSRFNPCASLFEIIDFVAPSEQNPLSQGVEKQDGNDCAGNQHRDD